MTNRICLKTVQIIETYVYMILAAVFPIECRKFNCFVYIIHALQSLESMILKLDPSLYLHRAPPRIFIFRKTIESCFIYGCIGVLS